MKKTSNAPNSAMLSKALRTANHPGKKVGFPEEEAWTTPAKKAKPAWIKLKPEVTRRRGMSKSSSSSLECSDVLNLTF